MSNAQPTPPVMARCICGAEVHMIDIKDKMLCSTCWAKRIERTSSAGRPGHSPSLPVSSLNSPSMDALSTP
jgi:hypothetical protein